METMIVKFTVENTRLTVLTPLREGIMLTTAVSSVPKIGDTLSGLGIRHKRSYLFQDSSFTQDRHVQTLMQWLKTHSFEIKEVDTKFDPKILWIQVLD